MLLRRPPTSLTDSTSIIAAKTPSRTLSAAYSRRSISTNWAKVDLAYSFWGIEQGYTRMLGKH